MRISIIGHFKDDLDEGVRLVGRQLAKHLELLSNQVQSLDISTISSVRDLRKFRPDIVHFVISPTVRGLVMSKMLSFWVPNAKTVVSAIHPAIPDSRLLRVLKPDLILTQAEDSDKRFKAIGFKTESLSNGVDIGRFRPLGLKERVSSREELRIPSDAYVVLHMASMRKERNLGFFAKLQEMRGIQTVIVGREGENPDASVRKGLMDAGCIVLEKHFPEVERVFNIADCYAFPTTNRKACIETPLSVLEAIACGLPVVSSRFGALPRVVGEVQGVFFADNEEEMLQKINILRTTKMRYSGEGAKSLSWNVVAWRLQSIYQVIAAEESTSK